jgi:hypothetical protein
MLSFPIRHRLAGFYFFYYSIAPFAREDLLLQLASQLEQAQPWFHKYSEIKV